ncbi:MAG TPA: HlyD family efflux transporter periplasmic adaptor subunit [bacterium]|nr:HlyD family efflux transporter periplasmic adaptor subunit [bacterium]HMY35068.1 HlyD family efflux transporter periplasmic adaptor subunit [bacterium]HMZ05525.1 HlyD family efflux transporter periplasmic adaptor subunit [bacterium]HND75913.1 HlyD family efflux transporter periplasmic adaptor subunit [bacterium]HNE83435.1 HlyD family efflux transporter periplasmic adaptor subunit [bacterium]
MDRKIEKKTWTPKRIAIIGGGALFVFFIAYQFLFGDNSTKLNVKSDKITIAKVTKGPFQEFIPVTGNVMPIKTIYLDAMEGGRVDKLFVEEGAMLKQGEEILKLTNTNLQMDVMFREAQLFEQINNLRNTRLSYEQTRLRNKSDQINLDYEIQKLKRTYDIQKGLQSQNLTTPQEFETARDEYDYAAKRRDLLLETMRQDSILRAVQMQSLEASIEHMGTNLNTIKENLANLTIRAPIAGQLTSRNAELGESKRSGDRLGQIDVLDGFKVRAGIDEHYIARIQIGQTGEFDLAGKTYNLVIKKVYPEVQNGRFEVDMEFQGDTPKDIRRGQSLQIRLELGDLQEAVLVPRGGFYQKTGGQWIFVVDPSGDFAVKRNIRLGRQNPQVFEVMDGIFPGEQVITSSYDSYGDVDKLMLNK